MEMVRRLQDAHGASIVLKERAAPDIIIVFAAPDPYLPQRWSVYTRDA